MQEVRKMMQEIRTMMEMMTSTSPDAVLSGFAMFLSTNPAAAHRVLLSRRSAVGQSKQSPQPRRRSAAGGILPGIKGHRLQNGQNAQVAIKKC